MSGTSYLSQPFRLALDIAMAGLTPAAAPFGTSEGVEVSDFQATLTSSFGWPVFAVNDAGEFRWSLSYGSLRAPDVRGAGHVAITTLTSSAPLVQQRSDAPGDVMIVMPARGQVTYNAGGKSWRAGPGQAMICQTRLDDLRHAADDGDYSARILQLNFRCLEAILFDSLQLPIDRDLKLFAVIDLTAPDTGGFSGLITGIASDGFIAQSRRLSARLQRSLLDALARLLLESVPHRYTDQTARSGVGPLPTYMKHARDLLLAETRSTANMAQVARTVGVSVRTLETGFRAYLNTTPSAYLRLTRLQRAHAILKAGADPRPIADIARACGLTHAGRFSQYYLKLFGETPSETRRNAQLPPVV